MFECENQTAKDLSDSSEAQRLNEDLTSVINQVVLPAVCVFGMVGNLLNLTILTRRKLQKSFRTLEQAANLCLISLAVSDLMFCVFVFPHTFLPADDVYEEKGLLLYYRLYCAAVINIFIMESTLLTVAMSLERYLACCFPLRQDLYLTTRRIKYVIVFTVIFSVAFNIPVFWRYEVITLCATNTTSGVGGGNATLGNVVDLLNGSYVLNHSGDQEAIGASLSLANLTNTFSGPSSALPIDLSNTNLNNNAIPSSSSSSLSSSILQRPSGYSSWTTTTPTSLPKASSFVPSLSLSSLLSPLSSTSSSSSSSHLSLSRSSSNSMPTPAMSKTRPTTSTISATGARTAQHTYSPIRFSARPLLLKDSVAMDTVYRILWACFGNFIPLLLLFYFNVCLCRKIFKSFKLRRQFKRQAQAKSSSHILTITLVVIVVMFFILVAPSEIVLHVAQITNSNTSPTYKSIEAVLNLMQSINFSVNFILYCIISPYFRKTLKYLMLCGCYNIYQVSKEWKKEFETSLM